MSKYSEFDDKARINPQHLQIGEEVELKFKFYKNNLKMGCLNEEIEKCRAKNN